MELGAFCGKCQRKKASYYLLGGRSKAVFGKPTKPQHLTLCQGCYNKLEPSKREGWQLIETHRCS